jgi:hypothetical protein
LAFAFYRVNSALFLCWHWDPSTRLRIQQIGEKNMKGQKIRWQLPLLLLASAALVFGQAIGPAPAGPQQQWSNVNSPAHPSEPVGPGTINYVEGQVSLDGAPVTPQSIGTATLKPGQTLDTGEGFVEVLLTPGAFLRVGHNSEVRIVSAGLADTQVELVRGASMLEVDQIIQNTNLSVLMNGATAHIQKNGLYNFDTARQTVMVLDGKAKIETTAGNKTVNKHDEVLLASKHPLKTHSIDEKAVKADPLYVWSKARSEDEAQASAKAANYADSYASVGPGWYWDPYWGFYGFWPYDAAFLYSPFGWGFYSPAFFGFGYYGGLYGGGRWYPRPGVYGHPGWYGHPGGIHGRVGGVNANVRGFHGGSFGGFHGGMGGGFHGGGMGGGFHGGGMGGGGRR